MLINRNIIIIIIISQVSITAGFYPCGDYFVKQHRITDFSFRSIMHNNFVQGSVCLSNSFLNKSSTYLHYIQVSIRGH
jgi:hypothetical protein